MAKKRKKWHGGGQPGWNRNHIAALGLKTVDQYQDWCRTRACGGRLRLIAALTDPASVRRYLSGVGLPCQPPPLTPPRPPPQTEWDFAA